MPPRKAHAFDDELLRLRQRLNSAAPAPSSAATGVPVRASSASNATSRGGIVDWVSEVEASRSGGHTFLQLAALHAALPSSADSRAPINAAPVAEALARFTDACANIDDFVYDGDAEEADFQRVQRSSKHSVVPSGGPFDFIELRTSAESHAVASETRTAQPLSVQETALSSVCAKSVLQRPRVSQKPTIMARLSTSNSELYAIPEDVAARHGIRQTTQGDRRRAASSSRAGAMIPTPPRPVAPPTSVDWSFVKRKVPGEPTMIVQLSDGAIAFCSACHKVVIGTGRGRCPHCGAVNEGVPLDDEVSDGVAINAGDDFEDEEARKFREAVAEWRSGQPIQHNEAEGDAVRRCSGKGFAISVTRVGSDLQQRTVSSQLYFRHIWDRAFS
jgi:hypothetical protein